MARGKGSAGAGVAPGLTAVLVVIAALLLPVSLTVGWARLVVLDTDRYVAAVAPLASDAAVKDWAQVRLQGASLQAIDLAAQRKSLTDRLAESDLSPLVRAGLELLLGQVEERGTEAVRTGVAQVVDGPSFAPAWSAAQRSAHQQLVAAVASGAGTSSAGASVSIDLDVVVRSVLSEVAGDGADTLAIPQVRTSVPVLTAAQLSLAHRAYGVLSWLSLAAPLAFLVLVGVAVGTARRRVGALAWLAVACLATLGLGLASVNPSRSRVLSEVGRLSGATRADVSVAGMLTDALTEPLRSTYVVTAAGALVLLLVCGIALLVRRRRPPVSEGAPLAW